MTDRCHRHFVLPSGIRWARYRSMAQHPLDGAIYEGFEYLGYSDQGGRPEAIQVMVADGYAYLGQSQGLTVLDVSDPRAMSPVFHRPVLGAQTWSGHLQVH